MPVPPKIRNRRGRDTALTGFAWVSLNALAVVWAAWALAGWSLDLTNLSARATLLLLSITLRATSQVVWFYKRGLKPYILGTKRAAGICAFNMLLDGVPLFFVLMDGTARSRVTSGDVVCLLLVLGGLAVERGSEIQRAAWKRKQRNKGKCYTRTSRHAMGGCAGVWLRSRPPDPHVRGVPAAACACRRRRPVQDCRPR